MNELGYNNDPSDTPSILMNLKLKNINRLVLGHLNINSLAGKFDQLKALIKRNIDFLVLAETKIDSSFPNAQFRIDGFSIPFRLDRNRFGGGVLINVRGDISCKELIQHKLPENIKGRFIEINLRKQKFLLFGGYRCPRQEAEYILKHVNFALDTYRQTYDRFILIGNFNLNETDPLMSEFFHNNDSKNLVKENTCFKNPNNLSCIDLFITNSSGSFQNTTTLATGLSDCHKMILTVLKTTFPKAKRKEIVYRNYKNFDLNIFKNDLRKNIELVDNYEVFETEFLNVLNNHAPQKKKVIRANHVPYMTKPLPKAIMKRSQLENKYLQNYSNENKSRYKKQKIFCSRLYKKERNKFYSKLDIKNFTDNKQFWKTMKPFLSDKCNNASKISLVHKNNVISEDQELANTFNDFFEHAVDNLGIKEYASDENNNLISNDPIDNVILKYKNHPSIIMINQNVSFESRFNFQVVNENDIKQEVSNLN